MSKSTKGSHAILPWLLPFQRYTNFKLFTFNDRLGQINEVGGWGFAVFTIKVKLTDKQNFNRKKSISHNLS